MGSTCTIIETQETARGYEFRVHGYDSGNRRNYEGYVLYVDGFLRSPLINPRHSDCASKNCNSTIRTKVRRRIDEIFKAL